MIKGYSVYMDFFFVFLLNIDIMNGYIPNALVNGLISKGVTLFEMPPLTTLA